MLRLLAPALGGFALLARLGPRTPSSGARVAIAYMTITTASFLCAAVGAPAPYRRRLRLGAAVLAACSPVSGPRCWNGCGVPPTGRSSGCSMRLPTSLPRPARLRGRGRPRRC